MCSVFHRKRVFGGRSLCDPPAEGSVFQEPGSSPGRRGVLQQSVLQVSCSGFISCSTILWKSINPLSTQKSSVFALHVKDGHIFVLTLI